MDREWTWHSERLESPVSVARWGVVGTPCLVFPPRAAEADEIERCGLVEALGLLLADRRIKLYSVADAAGRAWARRGDPLDAAAVHNAFNDAVIDEVIPHIVNDSGGSDEVFMVGVGFGALHAVTMMCRIPEVTVAAVGLSGTFDLGPMLDGRWSDDVYFVSPIDFVAGASDQAHLERIRRRFALLATGTGADERPGESWWLADVLGGQGIPNRVDAWPGWAHGWETWRTMLPGYLHDMLP